MNVMMQQALMTEEATLHMWMSGIIAEMTQLVAQARVPLGLPGSQSGQATNADIQSKLQLM